MSHRCQSRDFPLACTPLIADGLAYLLSRLHVGHKLTDNLTDHLTPMLRHCLHPNTLNMTDAALQDSKDNLKHMVSLGSRCCVSHLSHACFPEGHPFLFPRICCICCIYWSCYILSAIQPKLVMS